MESGGYYRKRRRESYTCKLSEQNGSGNHGATRVDLMALVFVRWVSHIEGADGQDYTETVTLMRYRDVRNKEICTLKIKQQR